MEDDEEFVKKSIIAEKLKSKSMFDDDVTEEDARSMFKSHLKFSVDDDDDKLTFGTLDTKSGGFGSQDIAFEKKSGSHPPAPDLSSLATPAARTRPAQENKSMSNSSSFGGASRAMGFGHTRSQSLTFGQVAPEKVLQRPKVVVDTPSSSINSLQDLDEIGVGSRKQLSASDIDKMQQEIQSLRRSLLSARKDRWVKLPIDDTLRRILKGEEFSLEMYRSLSDKLTLLDKAVATHDGNAITAAVLFLQRTVTRHIFHREIVQRQVAANHYLQYLKAHYDYPEYINTLIMLGRTEEAAICKYQLALPTTDVNVKISKLKDCQRSHFQTDPALSHDASLVQEHIDLLERQRPIDESDANLEASGRSALFKDFPRKRSLVDMSVVTTLYYCCLYHYHLGENSLASPVALRKRHQISDKQYTWTAIGARAKLRQWKDIEAILTAKHWFGTTKLKATIGFDKVVAILHRNAAPQDILQKYISMIDNPELRLNLAKKVSCSLAIIDALVVVKDRSQLEKFASKLDRYSKEGLYAFDILNTSTIKWK